MKLMLRNRTWIVLAAGAVLACSTKQKLDRTLDSANDTAKEAKALFKSLNGLMAKLGDVPKLPATNLSPAGVSGVKVPSGQPTAIDPTTARNGQQGSISEDLDGDGDAENLSFLVDDAGPTFFWWKDDGTCYLGWDAASQSQLVFGECDGQAGAYMCSFDASGEQLACSACNAAGSCQECTEQSCEMPAPAGGNCDLGAAETIANAMAECQGDDQTSAQSLCDEAGAEWVSSCAASIAATTDCATLEGCFAE